MLRALRHLESAFGELVRGAQSSNTATNDCNRPPSEHVTDSSDCQAPNSMKAFTARM
jgi:hypothetical protein